MFFMYVYAANRENCTIYKHTKLVLNHSGSRDLSRSAKNSSDFKTKIIYFYKFSRHETVIIYIALGA